MNVDRQVAIGDLVLFTPLALPFVGGWVLDLLLRLNAVLGLPGAASGDALAAMLVNLLGVFGVCFAVVRLRRGPTSLRREAMLVKSAAAVLIALAIWRGAPAILGVIALADAAAAMALRLLAGPAAPAAAARPGP